jgi:HEAT repeat protein
MDGRTSVALACAAAGGLWALGASAVLGGRLRQRRRRGHIAAGAEHPIVPPTAVPAAPALAAREHLLAGLRSDAPDVRRACVVALGRLADRHEWAVDGLIEALAERLDMPARVAAELDRIAPRADMRLLSLLGHPNGTVRYYTARLLAREEGGRGFVPRLVLDPSPHVRVAALQALATAPSPLSLAHALRLLRDPDARVRAQACRTSAAICPAAAGPLVVWLLDDESWEVRNAAHGALVAAGDGAAEVVLPLLDRDDGHAGSLAALVLQDTGYVDDLLADGRDPRLLERIFAAGGERLRALAAERARSRPREREAVS